jgi:hypothetical protein
VKAGEVSGNYSNLKSHGNGWGWTRRLLWLLQEGCEMGRTED